jgi:hypothetical protein
MNQKFTQEDIIQYIYNETSPDRSKLIADQINKDRATKLFYLETKDLLKKLDYLKDNPSPTSLNIVMEQVSQSSSLEETH